MIYFSKNIAATEIERNEQNERKQNENKFLIDIETDRSHSILGQIKKCQLEFEPIIHQINISAVII